MTLMVADKQQWETDLWGIPRSWKLIPLDGNKRPIDPHTGRLLSKWNDQVGYNVEEICSLNSSYVQAVGVLHGPRSAGLLVLDADGPKAQKAFQHVFGRDLITPPTLLSSGLQSSTPYLVHQYLKNRRFISHSTHGSLLLE